MAILSLSVFLKYIPSNKNIRVVDTLIHVYFAEVNKIKQKVFGLKWPFGTHTGFLTCWEWNIYVTNSLDRLLDSQTKVLPGFLSSWEANLVFEWSTRFVLKMAK